MPTSPRPSNPRTPRGDEEILSEIAGQMSGEERSHHEREPLGFEDQLPGPVEPAPEQDPQFRPLLGAARAGLPSHEGYGLDSETHFRRRRKVLAAAGLLTAFVAVGWLVLIRGQIIGGGGDAAQSKSAVADARAQFNDQFGRLTAQLAALSATSTSTNSAAASLQTALTSLREQLVPAAATTTTSTPTR